MKPDTLLKRMNETVDTLNGIIVSRNLYLVTEKGTRRVRRVINAHIKDSDVCVMDLDTEEVIKIQGKRFVDGYGADVVI